MPGARLLLFVSNEPTISDVPVGFLLSGADATDALFFKPDKTVVVIEGNAIIEVPTLAEAFAMLFALIYALRLRNPKDLANTFDFIQKALMGLEDGMLRPRVLTLKMTFLLQSKVCLKRQ